MSDFNICIASYKRAGMVTSDKVFRNAHIIVPESQYEEYNKHYYYNGCKVIPLPDEADGNLVRKRNWILDNYPGNVLIVDDDYDHIGIFEHGKQYKMDVDQVDNLLQTGFQMCEDAGTVMWGLNVQSDPKFYREYSPFSFLSVVLGPFQAFSNCDLRYDEEIYLKEDYDMSLQVLRKYHKILRFNKFYYQVDHFDRAGGCQTYRSLQKEHDHLMKLQKKWGSRIVRFDIKKDVDPIIKTPYKGI